ncbi:MAG: ABC transporter permease [Clostridiaceae bacterium]
MGEIKLEKSKVNSIKPKIRYDKFIDIVLMISVPIIFISLWQFFSGIGKINASILPAPKTIWETLLSMIESGDIFKHLGTSIVRVVKGYLLGGLLGITLGTMMGLIKRLDKALTVIIGLLRPIPVIAWVPMLILWLGIDEASKITVIVIGSFWPILLNTIHGIKNTDKKYLEVARTLEKSNALILFKVVLPSALPSIFTGLRIGIGNAWMSVVGAELIAAASGIGYLISYAREVSQPDMMLVGVCSIGIIGLLIDFLIKAIEKKVLRWNINIQG